MFSIYQFHRSWIIPKKHYTLLVYGFQCQELNLWIWNLKTFRRCLGSHEFSRSPKNVTDGFPWPLGRNRNIVFHAGNWNLGLVPTIGTMSLSWLKGHFYCENTLKKVDDILSWLYTVCTYQFYLISRFFWQVFLQILFGRGWLLFLLVFGLILLQISCCGCMFYFRSNEGLFESGC